MRKSHSFVLMGLVGLMLLVVASLTADESFAQTDPNPEPECELTDEDPYGLRCLVEFISAEEPPAPRAKLSDQLFIAVVGEGDLIDEAPEQYQLEGEEEPGEENPDEPMDIDPESVQMNVFNSGNQIEYMVVMGPEMLKAIHDQQVEAGETSGTEGVEDPRAVESFYQMFVPFTAQTGGSSAGSSAETQGWSNGIDTREIKSPTTLWPWRTISQFSYGGGQDSGCSGTLIGPRHLVTAAHCINKQGTNQWYNFDVTPARNGASKPYGDTDMAHGTRWYFTPSQWRSCQGSYFNCEHWDWGLIVIPESLGYQTGWMGYVARPGNDLKSVTNWNRGYPACNTDKPNAPANCQSGRLYGDKNPCAIGSFHNKFTSGWHANIKVSCDLSGGHSGSPVYHYFYDANIGQTVPVVSMVVIYENCYTCGLFDFYPNGARRLTPHNLQTISWLRQTFP